MPCFLERAPPETTPDNVRGQVVEFIGPGTHPLKILVDPSSIQVGFSPSRDTTSRRYRWRSDSFRGRHLVSVRVFCHAERAHGTETGTVLVVTIAEEVVHETYTGIAAIEDVYSFYLLYMSVPCPSVFYVNHRVLGKSAPCLSVPPLYWIRSVIILLRILMWPLPKTPV